MYIKKCRRNNTVFLITQLSNIKYMRKVNADTIKRNEFSR